MKEKISLFITEIRKNNNLTQEEFANAIGTTKTNVVKWENGESSPSKEQYDKICERFNLTNIGSDKIETFKYVKEYILYTILLLNSILIIVMFFSVLNTNGGFSPDKVYNIFCIAFLSAVILPIIIGILIKFVIKRI